MDNEQNIILTGFMGTGKTTVGKLLAGRLDYSFVDTDDLVEQRNGRSIAAIFRESGEAAFRQMEREVARSLAGQTALVIATGGRLMLDPLNAEALSRNGRVFCLTATPATILARIAHDPAERERPLLARAQPERRIAALLQERAAQYRQFPQISTDGKTPEQVVQILLALINQNEKQI